MNTRYGVTKYHQQMHSHGLGFTHRVEMHCEYTPIVYGFVE